MFETFKDVFPKGFGEGSARYGLLFSHLEPRRVNGFMYYRHVMVNPEDREEVGRRFEAARTAFESKLWVKDLERWDKEYKSDSIRRNRKLEIVPLQKLDTEGLITHLREVSDNAKEMVYRHHIFTVPAVIPVGRYLASTLEWTGLDAGVLLAPLKGTSKVSIGAYAELLEVGAALTSSGIGPKDFEGQPAKETLAALKQRQDRLGSAVRAYLDAIGFRLAGGYDVADPCVIELPEMLIGAIWSSTEATSRCGADDAAVARVRDAVPEPHRARFDEILDDVRRTSRLRDERGMYNDIWGTGIARQTILEVGRRLAAARRIDEVDNALDATMDEQIALLRGAGGPSKAELVERTTWRCTAPLSEVPQFLGDPPTPPPPLDGLPPHAAEALRAVGVAMGELFMPAAPTPGPSIVGKPVSPGSYTGTARLVRHSGEFNRLLKGDVLVTTSTSSAFNVVLPLLGAIVTDRGGQLSHAAIVAREYGIPAVVGTLKATAVIPDGARIRVDGSTGRIDVL